MNRALLGLLTLDWMRYVMVTSARGGLYSKILYYSHRSKRDWKQPNHINTKKSLDKCQQAPGKCIPKEKTANTGEGEENEAQRKKVGTKEGKQKEVPSNRNTSRKNRKIHEQHNPRNLAENQVT
ncbi:hypothetical protein I7I51_07389 [Histoplasma capsulatum]|uniref:Secreted protein n=1 Tax=Ajellomyces capsulatus TaxID=5037 RepID=A0A8A1LXM8_AJECA|nr:predicted protein [Histoplasma mississippiense (nom. inval.)]EDN04696.1 predicted protein [Histoplasma mississippiense (nom. inval.)]QSS57970.1 hypothetical protein I7I51_07389 [Histoplasma capsulatum]